MSSASDAPLGGRPFGTFRLLESLGCGGCAEVYSATDPEGRSLALKIPFGPRCLGRDAGIALYDEAALLSRIEHAGVPRVHDVGYAGPIPYLATELVQGHTLAWARRAAGGRLTLPAAVATTRSVLGVVAAIHDAGVVHCDLKPENVIVDGDATHVVDFGAARRTDSPAHASLWPEHLVAGTPGFMSPEQMRGRRDALGPRSDLWAVGALFLWLVCGAERSISRLTSSDARARSTELGAFLPDGVARVVGRAIAPDPSARFECAAQMVDALESSLARSV